MEHSILHKFNTVLPYSERIMKLFQNGMEEAYFTVTAAQGYGKTQMAAQFAQQSDYRVVWLSLNNIDNVPSCFWHKLVQAFTAGFPELAAQLEKIEFPENLSEFSLFYRLFSKELYSGKQTVMIVDDFNCIQNEAVTEFFKLLIHSGLENFTLLIISSSGNAAALTDGNYNITTKDLRLNLSETRRLFDMYNFNVNDKMLLKIHSHADGWPLALYLMAEYYNEHPLLYDDFRDFDLSFIHRLFYNTYFSRYSLKTKKLLVKLALLDGFTMEMVNKLVDYDMETVLKFVNDFTFVSFDTIRKIYVFQEMYKEFLLVNKMMITEKEAQELYSVAGDCLKNSEQWLEAVNCYRRGSNYAEMVQIMTKHAFTLINENEAKFYNDQFHKLPAAVMEEFPVIKVIRAYIYVLLAELEQAQEELLRLERDFQKKASAAYKQLLGEVYISLAEISVLNNNLDFLRYYKKAAELIDSSMLRKACLPYVGNNNIIFMPSQMDTEAGKMRCAAGAGDLKVVEQAFFSVAPLIRRLLNGGGAGIEFLFAAEAAYHTRDFARAKEMAYHAVYVANEYYQHDIFCNAHVVLMKLELAAGNYEKAQTHMQTIINYINSKEDIWLFEMCECIKSWLSIYSGGLKQNSVWFFEGDYYNGASPPINSGREMYIHCYFLMFTKQYVLLSTYLTYFKRVTVRRGMWSAYLGCLVMQSVCFYHTGNMQQAADCFHEAYHMAYANHIVMPFVEQGTKIKKLLEYIKKTDAAAYDEAWLHNIYQKASSYGKKISSIVKEYTKTSGKETVKLSIREKEILNALAQGLTREEIANYYSISMSTVKKHITNVYNKLGAINRADAVYIATTNRLLSE